MEIPTMDDFRRLERNLNSKLEEVVTLLADQRSKSTVSLVLSIKDLEDQFKLSAYNQRKAREQGKLVYSKIGKEVHYKREDVENYVKSVTIKF